MAEAVLGRQGPGGSSVVLPLPSQMRFPQRRGEKFSVSMVCGQERTGALAAGVCGLSESLWDP